MMHIELTIKRFLKVCIALFCIVFSSVSLAEMKALADEFLSGVSGQSGLTLDLEVNATVAEFAYFDDSKGIALQGVRLSTAADPDGKAEFRFLIDILDDGAISFEFASKNVARFEIEDIRYIESPGLAPSVGDASLGGLFFDFDIAGNITLQNNGDAPLGIHNTRGGVYDIDFSIKDGRLGYRTNGNELFLDGLSLDVNSMGTILGATPGGELNLSLPNFLAELSVDAIRFSSNPNNHGVTNDVDDPAITLPSYGSLWANLDLNADFLVKAGGAEGTQGLTINSDTIINRLDVAWGDDTDWASAGHWLGALDITGQVDLVNLTVDVLDDPDSGVVPAKDYGVGLALAFERLDASFHVKDFVLGETKENIDAYVLDGSTVVKSIGELDINLSFADGIYDTAALTNVVYLQAGGNTKSGYQGLRLDTQLNIVSPNNESNLVYTDDGSSLMFSGLEAFVDGDITLDVTAAGNISGTEFYDGLRVGFEDLAFGYRVEGLRVAESTGSVNDLKNRELQAAQSINGISGGLTGLGGHPSLEGTLNGHITLGPGGNVGQEGITINSDLSITNGSMAKFIQADGTGNGVWLSGLDYDIHLRDMMLDVTNEGLRIYEGESWSKMDVTDFRIGNKDTGASFGRLILESYTTASETIISAGGAGSVCIGGSNVDSAACAADGGRWEDRGSEGLTIATKKHFKNKIELEGKRNRITWETDRTSEGTPSPVNGTGMQLVFDNFTTNDGQGLDDTYGFQSDYNIDVSRTRVLKKSDGLDSNGISGNKGDEKIMNADGTYRYVSPGALTSADIGNRPVGLAVRTRTSFKELDFERVNLVHPVGGQSTLLYGLKMQNFDVTTDITATPLN